MAIPVPQGTALAYHDIVDANDTEVDANCLVKNDSIGELSAGKVKLGVRYDADYSSLLGAVSFQPCSTALDRVGSAYLKTTKENAKLIEGENKIKIESIYGSYSYELADEIEFENEFQATSYAPKLPKSLVIYYQGSNGVGLTSSYKAMIFKEVK